MCITAKNCPLYYKEAGSDTSNVFFKVITDGICKRENKNAKHTTCTLEY